MNLLAAFLIHALLAVLFGYLYGLATDKPWGWLLSYPFGSNAFISIFNFWRLVSDPDDEVVVILMFPIAFMMAVIIFAISAIADEAGYSARRGK